MGDIIYSNVRDLMKQLDAIDPDLRKEFVKDLKRIAKPVQAEIVKAIPDRGPHRGMRGQGRLSWDNSINYKGKKVPAKSVSINFKSGGSRRSLTTSLIRVTVNSPIVALLDQAGKAHSKRGQQLLRIMGGKPSRWVWPAAERALPDAQAQAKIVLEKAANVVSRRFK